jgi:hypothetical protein
MVAAERKSINKDIGKLLKPNMYFNEIPLDDLMDICSHHGYIVVDEEGNRWSGFICGREGTAYFDLNNGISKTPVANAKLCLQWYKMEVSGRYEIIAYVG